MPRGHAHTKLPLGHAHAKLPPGHARSRAHQAPARSRARQAPARSRQVTRTMPLPTIAIRPRYAFMERRWELTRRLTCLLPRHHVVGTLSFIF